MPGFPDPPASESAGEVGLECGDERRCGSFAVSVSKSTLTHHFRVLREAGIITQRQDGTARLSKLRTDALEARFPGVLVSMEVRSGKP